MLRIIEILHYFVLFHINKNIIVYIGTNYMYYTFDIVFKILIVHCGIGNMKQIRYLANQRTNPNLITYI